MINDIPKSQCPDCGATYGECWHTKTYDDIPTLQTSEREIMRREYEALKAENQRMREIVATLANRWQMMLNLGVPDNHILSTFVYEDDMGNYLHDRCEEAWKLMEGLTDDS